MTSVALESGRAGTLPCMRKRVAYAFARSHGMRQRIVTPRRLGVLTGEPRAAVPSLA
jgi:hypothetical protein